jgi:V/A-type H+-transporting ATPase subunit I
VIVEMSRVEIVCLKEVLAEVLNLLHDRGIVHIQPLGEIPRELEGRLARLRLTEGDDRERTELEAILKKTRDLLERAGGEAMAPERETAARLEQQTTEELFRHFTALVENIERLGERHGALKRELDLLPHYARLVESFLSVKYAFERRVDWAMVGLILDRRWKEALALLREEIARVTRGRMEVSIAALDANRLVAIVFYDRRYEKDLEALVWSKGVDRLTLPEEYLGKPLEDVLAAIARRRRELPLEIAEAEENRRRALRQAAPELSALRQVAENRLEELAVRTTFLQSQFTVAIVGWAPRAEAPELARVLTENFGEKVFLRLRRPREDERASVPVALANPAPVRPFELLLKPMPPPRYGSLDPTVLLALFFPIFFGLIVGDVGHGVVILLGALGVRRFFPRLPAAVYRLLLLMGASATAFGLLFGELFGDLGKGWLHPLLFHRTENLIGLLIVALSLGVVHVFLGFLLGIVQSLRLKQRRQAVERAASLGALFAGLLILGAAARLLPASWFRPSLVLLLVLIPILIYAGGLIAMLELISSAGNILSYARLMALALAGVMLAEVANTFAGRLGSVVLGVLVAVLLHLLNLVMSLFSPSIQALRLHYVEFFSKFYEPGGVSYAPFKKGGSR